MSTITVTTTATASPLNGAAASSTTAFNEGPSTGPCGWFAYDITSGTNALACPNSGLCVYNTDVSVIQCAGTTTNFVTEANGFTISAGLFTDPSGSFIFGPSAVFTTGCVPSASASGSKNPFVLSCTASNAPYCATGTATTLGATLSAFACASSPRPTSLSTGSQGDFSLYTYITSTSTLPSPSGAAVLYITPTQAQQAYYLDPFGSTYPASSDPAIEMQGSIGTVATAPTAATTITTTLPSGVSMSATSGSGSTSPGPKSAAGPSVKLGSFGVKQVLGAAGLVAAAALYL